jgi:hypothetical protein
MQLALYLQWCHMWLCIPLSSFPAVLSLFCVPSPQPTFGLSLMPQRTALTDEDIRAEVTALEQQGHRRLLVLTGEHPKYTFDQFLHVSTHLHTYTRQLAAMAQNSWVWAAECSSIYPGMQPDLCCGC